MYGLAVGRHRVLEYVKGDSDNPAALALRLSWMAAGGVGYAVATLGLFLAAVFLREPAVLVMLPLGLAAAGGAALIDRCSWRCVGVGALLGAVLFWTLGYAIGLAVMVRG